MNVCVSAMVSLFSPDLQGSISWHKDSKETREMDMLQPILLPFLCWVVLSKVLLDEYLSNYAIIGRNWIIS